MSVHSPSPNQTSFPSQNQPDSLPVTRLRRTESDVWKLSLVASRTSNAVIITDANGRIEWVNEGFCRITEYAAEEVIGQKPGDLLQGPDTDPDTVLFMREKIAKQEGFQVEVINYSKSKRPYWIEAEIQPVYDEHGQLTNFIAIESDITNRKAQESALRQAKEAAETAYQTLQQRENEARQLALIARYTDNAVIITDARGFIEWTNEAFTKITGYTSADAAGKKPGDLLQGPETDPETIRFMQKEMAALRPFNCELINYTKDNIPYWIEIEVQPVFDEQGKLLNFVAIESDITVRKAYEDGLKKAKEEAEAATQAKSEFLAMMSHEIRTPMNGVIGMTSLLLDTHLSKEQGEFVDTIRSSADSLLTIINDILDFSKIESGQMEMEEHPLDLEQCVNEALDLLAPKAFQKKLELAYFINPDVPIFIKSDVTRIRQILVNLVSNAIKFTQKGDIFISVDAQHLAHQRYEIQVSVKDTGIGIPLERLDRLFKPFSQVDASTTRRYGGTGLGLAISQRLSEILGGRMWVESELGVGSTFHFTFHASKTERQLPQHLYSNQRGLNGKNVLIVDDNQTNQRILGLYAERWGMTPNIASSGPAALQELEQEKRFDAAWIDLQMPDMDGFTLAQKMKALLGENRFPLFLLTSIVDTGIRRRSRELGFAACINKPIKMSELYDNLIEHFGADKVKEHSPEEASLFNSAMGKEHPLSILLAEDNVVNQKVAMRMLSRLGYRADVAANGLEAITAVQRQNYDLILMDMHMPEMDGLEATRQIRQMLPAERQPHIVAMTAAVLEDDRRQCAEAGMDSYMSKPVRVEELISMLRESTPVAAH